MHLLFLAQMTFGRVIEVISEDSTLRCQQPASFSLLNMVKLTHIQCSLRLDHGTTCTVYLRFMTCECIMDSLATPVRTERLLRDDQDLPPNYYRDLSDCVGYF